MPASQRHLGDFAGPSGRTLRDFVTSNKPTGSESERMGLVGTGKMK